MKKIPLSFLLIAFSVFVLSCKSEKSSDASESKLAEKTIGKKDSSNQITGEFIHVDTAAVLKVQNKLYGVNMDKMAEEAIQKSNAIKTDDYDVINITVNADINTNTEADGWDEIVTIKSIKEVFKPQITQETKVVKYSSKKTE